MPGVFGAGGEEPGPGVLRFVGAVLPVWGRGERHREAVPFLWWDRQAAQEQAGDGEDTGGGEGWDEDQGPRQGEFREEGWSSGGSFCGDAGGGASGLRAARGRFSGRRACELR